MPLKFVEHQIVFTKESKVEGNILKNVHILGPISANGRTYPIETMRKALPMYEGKPSYINHGSRSVENKFAVVKNVSLNEKSGIWGDYHMNAKHPLFEQVKWWAENDPSQIGLSHSIQGDENKKNEVTLISAVESVDMVHAPATVAGLHEAIASPDSDEKIQLDRLVEGLYSTNRSVIDSAGAKAKLIENTKKFLEALKGKIMELKDATLEDLKRDRKDLIEAIEKPASEAAATLERKVQEALAKVPEAGRTEVFVEQVRATASDDKKLKALVDDRLAMLKPAKSTGKPETKEADEQEDDEADTEIEEDDEIDEEQIEKDVLKSLGIKRKAN